MRFLKKSEVVALIFPQFEGVIDTGKTKTLLLRIGLGDMHFELRSYSLLHGYASINSVL